MVLPCSYLVRPTFGGVTGNVQVASSTSLILANLIEDTEYNFEVAAINRIGLGPFSAMFNVTTLSARPEIDCALLFSWDRFMVYERF